MDKKMTNVLYLAVGAILICVVKFNTLNMNGFLSVIIGFFGFAALISGVFGLFNNFRNVP